MPRAGNRKGNPYYDKHSDRWAVRCYCEGKPHKLTAAGKTALRRKLALHQAERAQGLTRDVPKTLAAYLARYPDGRPALRARASTVHTYHRALARVIPLVGTVALRDFSARDAQAIFARLLADGYKPSTIRVTRTVLSTALKDAVKDGLVARNVVADTDPPKDDQEREGRWLRPDEIEQLLTTAEAAGDPCWPLWQVLLATGLRIGEVLGIRWQDIDWPAHLLHHQRQLLRSRGPAARYYLDLPKGGRAAVRQIPLIDDALRALRVQQVRQQMQRAAAPVWSVEWEGLVFTGATGDPLNRGYVQRALKRALARAGLPAATRVHDLRHSLASYLIAKGVPLVVVSEILGHADINVTRRYYAHVDTDVQRAALEQVRRRG